MPRTNTTSSLVPTRKWFATQVTALAGWAIAFVNVHGHWTETIIIALITIIAQAAVGWLVPNEATIGGVPVRRTRRKNERGVAGVNVVGVILLLIVIVLLFNVTHGLSLLLLLLIVVLLFL